MLPSSRRSCAVYINLHAVISFAVHGTRDYCYITVVNSYLTQPLYSIQVTVPVNIELSYY